MNRQEKKDLVASLNETFSQSAMLVVTHYQGLTVAKMSELRGQMREAGAEFKVVKNRLAKLALAGTPYEGLTDMFTGPVGIAFSDDAVAPAKVVVNFAKTNEKLVILGGGLGEQVLDQAGVKAMAELPSLDELRAKLVGMISTPATRIAGVLQAPGGQVARVISAYSSKDAA